MTKRILSLFIFLLFSFQLLHSQNKWELVKEEDLVKVYLKEDPKGEYVHIRAVTYASGVVTSFASIMHDVNNYNQWMHAVQETFVVAQQDKYDFSYYMLTDFPWPASDRDAVINMKFDWNPEKKAFITTSRNVAGLVPEKDGIERVEEVKASYTFKQKSTNQVEIEYRGRIKPGVKLPEWLMEKVYFIAPYNTLKNLRKIVLKEEYKNADFDLDQI